MRYTIRSIKAISVILLLGIFGCHHADYQQMAEYSGYTQGTTYHVICDRDVNGLDNEIDKLLKKIDRSVSVWDSLSLVSQFNRSSNGIWVDPYFVEVFTLSKRIHQETGGAFNPAIFPITDLNKMGIDTSSKKWNMDSLLRFSRFEDIRLSEKDSSKGKLRFLSKKYRQNGLDFQGIAQGYAVDALCGFLDAKNIRNYKVEVGSQMRAKGNNPHQKPWLISLDKPTGAGEIRVVQSIIPIGEKSVSVQGNYREFYEKGGQHYNKYIDPSTGRVTENTLLNVYVFAPTAAEANAYATAFMVMGAGNATRFLSGHRTLSAYLISSGFNEDFQTWISPELEKLIEESK